VQAARLDELILKLVSVHQAEGPVIILRMGERKKLFLANIGKLLY
jgi:hypothetical protein